MERLQQFLDRLRIGQACDHTLDSTYGPDARVAILADLVGKYLGVLAEHVPGDHAFDAVELSRARVPLGAKLLQEASDVPGRRCITAHGPSSGHFRPVCLPPRSRRSPSAATRCPGTCRLGRAPGGATTLVGRR